MEALVYIDPDVVHDKADQELVVVGLLGNDFAGELVRLEEVGLLAKGEGHGFDFAVCFAFEFVSDLEIEKDWTAANQFGFCSDQADITLKVGFTVPIFLFLGFHAAAPMREIAEGGRSCELALIIAKTELVDAIIDEVVIAVCLEGDS